MSNKRVNKLKKRKVKSTNIISISNNKIIIKSKIDVYGAQLEFSKGVEIKNKHRGLNIQSGPDGKIILIYDQQMVTPLNEKVLFEYKSKNKLKAKLSKYILSDRNAKQIPNVIIK